MGTVKGRCEYCEEFKAVETVNLGNDRYNDYWMVCQRCYDALEVIDLNRKKMSLIANEERQYHDKYDEHNKQVVVKYNE